MSLRMIRRDTERTTESDDISFINKDQWKSFKIDMNKGGSQ